MCCWQLMCTSPVLCHSRSGAYDSHFWLWQSTDGRTIWHELGFSIFERRRHYEMTEINYKFFRFSSESCWFRNSNVTFSPLAGGWRANSPLFHILPCAALCVWKRLKNHLLSTPPPLLLVPYKGPQYPLPGRKCGNNITTETKSFRLFLSLTGKNFLKKTKNKRRNVF